MKRLLLLVIPLLVLVTGCTVETDPVTNVSTTSAVLHGKVSCKAGESGAIYWRYRSWNPAPFEPIWKETAHQPWTCPNTGLGSTPISKQITGLQSGTHYSYELCGYLELGDPKVKNPISCAGKDGDLHSSDDFSGPGESFYTAGPLRPDSGMPDPAEYAKRGLTVSTWSVTGSMKPGPGLCCATGYFAPAAPDSTTDALYGAKTYWGSSCNPANTRVFWLNEPTQVFLGLSVINGCHINDPTACAGGSCNWMWLNCWNPVTRQCDFRVPPWSFKKTWCNVITHEFGHLDGRFHSSDPHSLLYPRLDVYMQYNPDGAWNCAGK